MSNRTALTLTLAAVAAVLLWRWWMQRGTNRIEAQPASPSVSFEHLQEEADPEQLRYIFGVPGIGRFWKPTDEEHEHYRDVFTEPVGKVNNGDTC